MLAHAPAHRCAVPTLAFLLFAACSDTSLPPTAPSLPSVSSVTSGADASVSVAPRAANSPDLGGTWHWREITFSIVRPFAVELFFPIQPEGPLTKMTCESGGDMTIVMQTASTFSGSATQASVCRTQGGVVFNPVPMPFPPALNVGEGKITGNSFRMDFGFGDVPCPHNGAIRVEGGAAVELRGRGDCKLPDERLLGHEVNYQFAAWR